MRGNARNNKASEHQPPSSSLMSLLTEWVRQGTESFFTAQRILLDLVSRQNANVMHAIRDGMEGSRPSPIKTMAELAGGALTNFIGAQEVLLDLVHNENKIVMAGVKERVPATAGAIADMLRRSVETYIEMQHHFLKMAAKQVDAWTESGTTGKPYHGPGLVELAHEGLETFIHAQTRFLDVVAEETGNAAKAFMNGGPAAKPTKKTALSELAREGTNAFVDAQKQLLDLAGQQVAVNLKAGSKVVDMIPPFPKAALANLTRDTVETFVAAQKSLLDMVVKPRHTAAAATVVKTKPKARPPVHKAAAPKAAAPKAPVHRAPVVSQTTHAPAPVRAT